MKGQVKSMCDVAERLKNMGRQEERINAVKFAISLGHLRRKSLNSIPRRNTKKLWLL